MSHKQARRARRAAAVVAPTTLPLRRARRHRIIALITVCLLLASVALAHWRGFSPLPASTAPTAVNSNLSPANPAKEYIYAGGRLVATEEPQSSSGGLTVENVFWTNVVGVSVSGNSLTKLSNYGYAWNAGASSTRAIASGDGYAEFTATEAVTYRMLGLSNGDTDQSFWDIDFAIFPIDTGDLYVYEFGQSRGWVGRYEAGDRLRVSVENGVVRYWRNGVLLYTSNVTVTSASYPLLVDTSFYTPWATVTNATISGELAP